MVWNKYSFDDLKKIIEDRLSSIDYEPEKYNLTTVSSKNNTIQTIVITHNKVEYRLSYTCMTENLSWIKYGNLISPYRDFHLEGNRCEEIEIEIRSILIGAKLLNFEVNYPLLVDLSNRILNISQINISKHNKFRE